MTRIAPSTPALEISRVNVARRLTEMAARRGDAVAVVAARRRWRKGSPKYETLTFRQLDEDSNRLASGLRHWGVAPGTRLALLVRPGIDFITLVFALLKAGAVSLLIDPGMGRKNLVGCLAEGQPEGFIAVPAAQAVRAVLRRKFPQARYNVTVGGRAWWGGITLDALRRLGSADPVCHDAGGAEAAAIIFTSGSTGPPKGVLYRHSNFDRQVVELQERFRIQPGEVDMAAFPLFALFNAALGVTAVIPDMDASRPARVDPRRIIEAVQDWRATQAFGSPAVWNRVGMYCEGHQIRLPTLRRVLSAGAPVPPHVLRRMKVVIADDGDIHTPYGATEALPVASIAAGEVLGETCRASARGAGTCVGRRFSGIEWKIIQIDDGPIARLGEASELANGEIGELIVSGGVVTSEYVTRKEANAPAKIAEGSRIWHRMGDVGYLDDQDRFWFCGRMAHRVRTASGERFSIPCEAIFNEHPDVYRSALVGIGPAGRQRPVIVVEPWPGKMPRSRARRARFVDELAALARGNPITADIRDFLFHRSMPVDVRHNAKIFRERLAVWAAAKLR